MVIELMVVIREIQNVESVTIFIQLGDVQPSKRSRQMRNGAWQRNLDCAIDVWVTTTLETHVKEVKAATSAVVRRIIIIYCIEKNLPF